MEMLPRRKPHSSSTPDKTVLKCCTFRGNPGNDIYVQAEPVDGYQQLYEYFNRHLTYPPAAIKDSVEGVQTVSFQINVEGKPEMIQVKQSLGVPFEIEAARLIENMPAWKPATLNGKPVASQVSLPLTFQLRRAKTNE
jgi:protein TonB